MSVDKEVVEFQCAWNLFKAVVFAGPFVVWLSWVMTTANPKLSTAGGIVTMLSWVSAFTAGLLVVKEVMPDWSRRSRLFAAFALVALALLLGYVVMTATWLRYPAV